MIPIMPALSLIGRFYYAKISLTLLGLIIRSFKTTSPENIPTSSYSSLNPKVNSERPALSALYTLLFNIY